MNFGKVSEIDISNIHSWENIYLTFDVDWASDEVINYTIDLLEMYNAKATFFITHDSKVLNRLRQNNNFELGIHPNFNYLLNGSTEKGLNFNQIIENILRIVPEAVSVRSHSMTQNSYILDAFKKFGLTHDCNHYISNNSNIELKPWLLWNGLIRCPYFWEDDIYAIENNRMDISNILCQKGLKIFDFHPIHIFLNMSEISHYELTRKFHNDHNILSKYRRNEYGTENILKAILDDAKKSNY
jgi:hypothetical protein